MPELPEVETTLRGLQPDVTGQTIKKIIIRHHQLRWPIPADISHHLLGKKIISLSRRAKYLLFQLNDASTILLHLGMSGSLQLIKDYRLPKKHDHVELELANHFTLRFNDPRRFGAFLWVNTPAIEHPLLRHLGIEPLDKQFSGKYLWQKAQKRQLAIKTFIMNNTIVVGVGNIYAAEALFRANIHPKIMASSLSLDRYKKLAQAIRFVLKKAIAKGGTTLKDFVNSQGKPGYFSHQLQVYGRAGEPCFKCGTPLENSRIGQRATVYCKYCQL